MSELKQYLGTKAVNAVPMTRLAYNQFRGWGVPSDENGDDEGFLVEYIDGGKANTPSYKGYVSWSPKDVFNRAYKEIDASGFGFGVAIDLLEQGVKVARAGWNGKGMWLSYSPGAVDLPAEYYWSANNREFAVENGGKATTLPYITMKTAGNEIVPWLASQTDVLAKDWVIVA